MRQSRLHALPHRWAAGASPQLALQVTAPSTSSAWFGGEGLKACNACGRERVWDWASVGRTMCGTGQGRRPAVVFFAGGVQRGLQERWRSTGLP